ncbi:hypothetical protein FA95DRAFT_336350 [Auriscalpium vulgare]|uniref:Uncharacterized protein n=1 Tax=Auriscalpium vulgare TaxID=40419 RepID=A0ACB8RJ91_9AGAM|nr:hypothetical protein FA95DRAFT_336350 [Auriscalpium vulgare]
MHIARQILHARASCSMTSPPSLPPPLSCSLKPLAEYGCTVGHSLTLRLRSSTKPTTTGVGGAGGRARSAAKTRRTRTVQNPLTTYSAPTNDRLAMLGAVRTRTTPRTRLAKPAAVLAGSIWHGARALGAPARLGASEPAGLFWDWARRTGFRVPQAVCRGAGKLITSPLWNSPHSNMHGSDDWAISQRTDTRTTMNANFPSIARS